MNSAGKKAAQLRVQRRSTARTAQLFLSCGNPTTAASGIDAIVNYIGAKRTIIGGYEFSLSGIFNTHLWKGLPFPVDEHP